MSFWSASKKAYDKRDYARAYSRNHPYWKFRPLDRDAYFKMDRVLDVLISHLQTDKEV